MKICILDAYTTNPGDLSWEGLEALAEVTAYDETGTKELVLERAADAEIVLTNKTPLDRDIIFALPKLKFIGVLATGFNVVDIKAAKEKGVPVSNIPTYGTKSVAPVSYTHLDVYKRQITRNVTKKIRAVPKSRIKNRAPIQTAENNKNSVRFFLVCSFSRVEAPARCV